MMPAFTLLSKYDMIKQKWSNCVRIDKFLAASGIGSRVEVKEMIRKGRVSVNNTMIRKADLKIDPDHDQVFFDQVVIKFQANYYYMLNKPSGVVSATQDNYDKTVVDLLKAENRKDLFPVGRLDKDTTGLLILTDDGDFAHKILSPKKHVPKTYLAVLDGELSQDAVHSLESGLDIGDEKLTLPATVNVDGILTNHVRITITEGRFHQVKRMFYAVGREVLSLKRIQIGNLILDPDLPEGNYKLLSKEEIGKCFETPESEGTQC